MTMKPRPRDRLWRLHKRGEGRHNVSLWVDGETMWPRWSATASPRARVQHRARRGARRRSPRPNRRKCKSWKKKSPSDAITQRVAIAAARYATVQVVFQPAR